MPIYEYQCRECDRRSEEFQKMSDPPLTECAECGGELRKLISAPAVQFKGSGWYVTDYAKSGSKKTGDGASASEGSGGAEGSGGSSDAGSGKESSGSKGDGGTKGSSSGSGSGNSVGSSSKTTSGD